MSIRILVHRWPRLHRHRKKLVAAIPAPVQLRFWISAIRLRRFPVSTPRGVFLRLQLRRRIPPMKSALPMEAPMPPGEKAGVIPEMPAVLMAGPVTQVALAALMEAPETPAVRVASTADLETRVELAGWKVAPVTWAVQVASTADLETQVALAA